MKAGRIHFYGGPEQLVYEDASQPHPVKNQMLIRVYTSGVKHHHGIQLGESRIEPLIIKDCHKTWLKKGGILHATR